MSIARIELSRSALVHNARQLKALVPDAGLVAVVKGNAYGHGMLEVASVLEGEADWFQVDDLEELRLLRSISQKQTLVLGFVPKEDLEDLIRFDGVVGIYDRDRLEPLQQAAQRAGKPARIHVKIDTLLGRQGLLPSELGSFLDQLNFFSEIRLEGAYTHFANIEDTTDFTHGQAQVDLFETALGELASNGHSNLVTHIASTSGLFAYERLAKRHSLVRAGIGLYGLYPSEALARVFVGLDLRPVMTWKTQLAQVKVLPPGHPVGYGLTFVTWRETRVGIVPQGYADGFDRGLSNCGHALVRGSRCPIVGRIAMNMFAIDLTSVPDAAQGDEVVILGRQDTQAISSEEIAGRIGTINYEVVARVSPLLARALVP